MRGRDDVVIFGGWVRWRWAYFVGWRLAEWQEEVRVLVDWFSFSKSSPLKIVKIARRPL